MSNAFDKLREPLEIVSIDDAAQRAWRTHGKETHDVSQHRAFVVQERNKIASKPQLVADAIRATEEVYGKDGIADYAKELIVGCSYESLKRRYSEPIAAHFAKPYAAPLPSQVLPSPSGT